MALTTAGQNLMLDALGAASTYVGLSNAGTELTGGSPAYARQAITFGAAAAGSMAMSGGTRQFNVPASSTVNQFDLYSALAAGTRYGSGSLTSEVYGGQGLYDLTAVTATQT